jgi:predicted flap endonuclease-1-like 5' DNA nuclease
MSKLTLIEGIGEAFELKLKAEGITSVEKLLEGAKTKHKRTKLEEATGISEKLILKFANHADLFRIKGIGGEYAELLEAAGVDTIPELSKRKAVNLLQKMLEVNDAKKLVRRPPTEAQVEDWVAQAGKLERALEY